MQGEASMSQQPRHRVWGWQLFALAAALLLGGALPAPAQAAEGDPTDHALSLIPADAYERAGGARVAAPLRGSSGASSQPWASA